MSKPLIGITPLFDNKKEIYFMRSGYTRGIEKAGGIPVMLPLTNDHEMLKYFAKHFDGFLFSGGHDLTARLYGAEPIETTYGDPIWERDQMEKYLMEMVLKRNKPILGICRGIQMINVVFGGDLYQDLPTQFPSDVQHLPPRPATEDEKPSSDENMHGIRIDKVSPLFELIGDEHIDVNSYHHQALKRLGDGLVPMAWAKDGIVEAVYAPGYDFVWGVQWHPEILYESDGNAMKVFQVFVDEAARQAKKRKLEKSEKEDS